jgi:hypothetical protein
LGIDRTLVAIDCRSVRLCFILDFWRMIAAASIELILNPLDREGIAGIGFNRFMTAPRPLELGAWD